MGPFSISPQHLYASMGRADAPLVFDVCRCEDFDAEQRLLPSARWREHHLAEQWHADIPRGARAVVVCVRGRKVSQAAAAQLRRNGIDASFLEGGFEAWRAAGLPTIAKRLGIGNRESRPTSWITRVRPKIDRVACPWLISRFLDPAARFFYVEAEQVLLAGQELDAIPYDVPGVEITHRGDQCSFDALIADFGIRDAALDRVAGIIRGADTARPDLAPEAAGLLAIALGISQLAGPVDHLALEHGFVVYDALYAWARHASAEAHSWQAPTA
jgi:rhodanese-related sulfurtransferase